MIQTIMRINRNIVECKVNVGLNRGFCEHSINRNIVECKDQLHQVGNWSGLSY